MANNNGLSVGDITSGNSVSLTAAGTGNITQVAGTVVTTDTLNLKTSTGSIASTSGSFHTDVNNIKLTTSTNGNASIDNDGDLNLLALSMGGGLTLTTSGDLTTVGTVTTKCATLTATDGATVLDRSLALLGFGIVLPVVQPWSVMEALDVEGTIKRPFDLGTRGTRHRAAATYARTTPGCIVFVASQDGEMGCMYRSPEWDNAVLWRFGPCE